jgi:very-short-patch-repair endonuclease
MKQVTRDRIKPIDNGSKKQVKKKKQTDDLRLPKFQKKTRAKRTHPAFGTSKLEQDFATDFLDKLGVRYTWQFEAKEIKRFFDYYLPDSNLIIEINGSYWHGDSRIYEQTELNRTQKRNIKVDEYKKEWALLHGIPIMYIWEKDIRENPKKVMQDLKERLFIEDKKVEIKKEKNKRHKNNLNNL